MVATGIVSVDERERIEDEEIDTFLTELGQFQSRDGPFESPHIWIIVEDEKTVAHEWYDKYSIPFKKSLW